MAQVSAIAAIGRNRELGKGNELLWRIPDDLKRFKQLTLGHPVIMGRKTFESIFAVLGKPLPGRTNVVVTRDPSWQQKGVLVAGSIEKAIEMAKQAPGGEEVFVGGGGEIYRLALPFTGKLYLTLIDDEKEADSFFPDYRTEFTRIIREEFREHCGLKYCWVVLERVQPRE